MWASNRLDAHMCVTLLVLTKHLLFNSRIICPTTLDAVRLCGPGIFGKHLRNTLPHNAAPALTHHLISF